MENDVLTVEIPNEDRYSRLREISWWDHEKIRRLKILVVGAGALGNEILKNLALLGVGEIIVVDLDRIESSNLSRSILFRPEDEGSSKAHVAAKKVIEINSDVKILGLHANIMTDIGLGVFRWADFIIGGLDNREARLHINRACWKVNKPYIDGAIEALNGFARVFMPTDGPCYECTMNEADWKLIDKRKSCALLSRAEMATGKIPTTPTSSSVIAAIEVQEMLKILHSSNDLPNLSGKCFVFNGLTHDSYIIQYQKKNDCMSHETYETIEETDFTADETSVNELLDYARSRLDENALIELSHDIVESTQCTCGYSRDYFKPIDALQHGDGECPKCGRLVQINSFHTISGQESFLNMTLGSIGIPHFEIIKCRSGNQEIYVELSKDRWKFIF